MGFFASYHGVNPCDAAGNDWKRLVRQEQRRRLNESLAPFSNMDEVIKYVRSQQSFMRPRWQNSKGVIYAIESREMFFFAENAFDAMKYPDAKPFPRIMSHWSFATSPHPDEIRYRKLTCTCDHCLSGHYEDCVNKQLVGAMQSHVFRSSSSDSNSEADSSTSARNSAPPHLVPVTAESVRSMIAGRAIAFCLLDRDINGNPFVLSVVDDPSNAIVSVDPCKDSSQNDMLLESKSSSFSSVSSDSKSSQDDEEEDNSEIGVGVGGVTNENPHCFPPLPPPHPPPPRHHHHHIAASGRKVESTTFFFFSCLL